MCVVSLFFFHFIHFITKKNHQTHIIYNSVRFFLDLLPQKHENNFSFNIWSFYFDSSFSSCFILVVVVVVSCKLAIILIINCHNAANILNMISSIMSCLFYRKNYPFLHFKLFCIVNADPFLFLLWIIRLNSIGQNRIALDSCECILVFRLLYVFLYVSYKS